MISRKKQPRGEIVSNEHHHSKTVLIVCFYLRLYRNQGKDQE